MVDCTDDSPWYPTARLFRQQQRSDWDGVVESLHSALAEVVRSPPAPNIRPQIEFKS
jgi:hypothetical protein